MTSTQLRVQCTHILSISLALGWRMISGADKVVSAWNRGTFPRIRELKACRFLSEGQSKGHSTQGVNYTRPPWMEHSQESRGKTHNVLEGTRDPLATLLLGGIQRLLVGNNDSHHPKSFPAAPAWLPGMLSALPWRSANRCLFPCFDVSPQLSEDRDHCL